jgi:hypothetical protein
VTPCIMGAVSSDGIHWQKTSRPIGVHPRDLPGRLALQDLWSGVPEEYFGGFHRPSLMFDEGRWRLWYTVYEYAPYPWVVKIDLLRLSMRYAENRGSFMDVNAWQGASGFASEATMILGWASPSVVRVFRQYYCFGDPVVRSQDFPDEDVGDLRQIAVAESHDGYDWEVAGPLASSSFRGWGDRKHSPGALVVRDATGASLYLFYAWGPGLSPYDVNYKRIRVAEYRYRRALRVPSVGGSWTNASRVLGNDEYDVSSFSVFKVERDWYCIGSDARPSQRRTLFQGTTHDLRNAFDSALNVVSWGLLGRRISSGLSDTTRMTGPFVVNTQHDPYLLVLFYSHFGGGEPPNPDRSGIRALWYSGRGWTARGLAGTAGMFLFREPGAQDPMVIWDAESQEYVMYYAVPTMGIRARTSSDLVRWSEPRTVLGVPPGYMVAEAPFVVPRGGYYYLFVSGIDYGRMSVYASVDPFNFGDAGRDRLTEIPGHAARIVCDKGRDYIYCCAISSTVGNPPRYYDLKGVYRMPLGWSPTPTTQTPGDTPLSPPPRDWPDRARP